MVEQLDTETFDNFVRSGASNVVDEPLHQLPILSRTWFDTGAFFDEGDLRSRFRIEYFQNPVLAEYHLPDRELPDTLVSARERHEAARACKGRVIRQETYAVDNVPGVSTVPYSVSEYNVLVQRTQPLGTQRNAVFSVSQSEAITYTYERNPAD